MIHCTRSEFAEAVIQLDGRPFSLDDFPFYRSIYDLQYQIILMMCGRQVAKSTSICNRSVSNSATIPFWKTLYVAPSQDAAQVFSTSRLDPTIKLTPQLAALTPPGVPLNVYHKRFLNGSEIRLGYAKDNGDRIRGRSADEVLWDEIQDIALQAVAPVVNESAANSNYGYEFYAGTPKSMENGIQILWEDSTQDEWIIPCVGCGSWNAIMSDAHIGKRGIVCAKCKRPINARAGQWHSMNPGAKIKGYHISQFILPLNSEMPSRWQRLLRKYETYEESKFKNEVLGISDARGTRLLSIDDLRRGCQDYTLIENPTAWDLPSGGVTVAGVDWSGGGSATYTSRSALWIANYSPTGKVTTLYFKIYPTRNPVEDVRDIAQRCRAWGVQRIVGDAGVGAVANAYLAELYGEERVSQAQYGAFSKGIAWNGRDRFNVDKTSAIDTVMKQMRDGAYVFPREDLCTEVFADILAEYEETTNQGAGRRVWRHVPKVPDDALHAAVFCWIAAQLEIHGTTFFYR